MTPPIDTPKIIDCDIHNIVPKPNTLHPYLPAHWQEIATQSDLRGPASWGDPFGASRPNGSNGPASNGQLPDTDLDTIRSQVLDKLNIDIGILNCAYAVEGIHNPYGAAAFASAVNDWQVAEWLEKDSRLRASLIVPSQDPALAAEEIHRLGDHPGFVQVFLPARSKEPYGTRRFHPLLEAAVAHDLVVGIHFGGEPGTPPTSSGWPSYYVEEASGMSHIFQSQLISLIIEGAFEQFPTLKVALIASGVSWLPSLMWRMDKEWKGLRREIPWVKRLPSDYMRQHVRLTVQPFDAPPNPEQLGQILDQIGSDEMLMFSTDYPYSQFDSVSAALPSGIATNLEQKILADNARAFYAL